MPDDSPIQRLVESLNERAKELSCLYRVDEILSNPDRPLDEVCEDLVAALPAGWQHSQACSARIRLRDVERQTAGFKETPWGMRARIVVEGEPLGLVAVHYDREQPPADEGAFLKEERKLINTIAERIGFFVTRRNLRRAHDSLEHARRGSAARQAADWSMILDFLRRTDPELLRRVTRRMINRLGLLGIEEAEALLHKFLAGTDLAGAAGGENEPLRKTRLGDLVALSEETFRIAARNLGEEEMVASIRGAIDEERSGFLIEALEDQNRGLSEIVEAIGQHRTHIGGTSRLSAPARRTLSAALLRRLFTEDLHYISVAKEFVELEDVYDLVNRIVYPSRGHGKLGGKTAGLFLATQILRKAGAADARLAGIKVPRSWYISSDALPEFLNYNNLRDLYFRKYVEVEQIRQEYPHIVHVLKNSHFPPEISRGMALALDDLEECPLIVRSSSLLEDRSGSSFAGKYKSLFLANRGSRVERLTALQDAVAEIYASVFGPDPIQYRAERGLLDVHEEMGISIQEVVGRRVGRYFLPAFSGVALSHNEFRWSPRLRREDGLVRMVPGLGTRAVDRVGDDYPILLTPGQPGLRVNVTPDEIVRYSPRWIDVIDMESNRLVTLEFAALLRECGADYPALRRIVSVVADGHVRKPSGLGPDLERDELVVTFEGLISDTPFVGQMQAMLQLLRERIGNAIDLEFASDGTDLYLLQCRAQSQSAAYAPAAIPPHIPAQSVLFWARRGISNGRVPDLTHVVYVDPDRYTELEENDLRAVGRIVSRLNKLLPRRQFALLGPGRWGSRGDIRLGVSVTYADISNTALLVEIARRKGGYVPELSFGTHFFQDLVEAEIRYIPLYPDEAGSSLDETFLRRAHNILPDLLPTTGSLEAAVRVIDVARECEGRILRVLMNADLDEAVALFDAPRTDAGRREGRADALAELPAEAHWRWRLRMAERIAAELDPARFGVEALYVFGSVKNGTAGPGSDIDLLVHVTDDAAKREDLALWFDGWSRALAEMNYLRTGYRVEGLLDVHYVTDTDVAQRSSFATKIDAVTDAARRLALGQAAATPG